MEGDQTRRLQRCAGMASRLSASAATHARVAQAAGSLTSIRPVALARLEHGFPRRRRALFDRTGTKAKAGAVAGAGDRLALDLTGAELAAAARAAIVQRVQMPVMPQKQNGGIARHPAGRLAVLQLPGVDQSSSRAALVEGRLVDTDSAREREVTAEEATHRERRAALDAEQPGAPGDAAAYWIISSPSTAALLSTTDTTAPHALTPPGARARSASAAAARSGSVGLIFQQ